MSFLPAFVCGPALGYGWHVGLDPDLDAANADRARRVMLDAIETEARARGLTPSFVHVLDDESELRALLEDRGYLRAANVPVAVLDLGFGSFEDYLAAFPSKKRIEFRRQMSRNRETGTVIEIARGAEGHEERFLSLLDSNAQKHGGVRFACTRELFAALGEHLGNESRIFTATKSGVVSAVSVMLIRNRTAFPIAVGVDLDSADDYTYFQVTYNSPIAHAIELGIRRMYLWTGHVQSEGSQGLLAGQNVDLFARVGSARARDCPLVRAGVGLERP